MTCADCDLSGRCPCVLRRLERRRAQLLIQRSAAADTASSPCIPEFQDDNTALFEAAIAALRAHDKS